MSRLLALLVLLGLPVFVSPLTAQEEAAAATPAATPPASPATPSATAAVTAAATPAPDLEEIVRRTNHAAYYQGRDGRAQVTMTIRDERGRERTREFTILRRNVPAAAGQPAEGDQQLYVYFHRPADVNRTAYLVFKRAAPGQDDDRWLYLPALDLVRRIAAGDKRTSFVGSDFCYEDVSGRSPLADRHELAETTAQHYVLDNVPLDPDRVEFSRFRMWIRRDNFLPERVEYYDRQQARQRVYELQAFADVAGHPTPTRARMQNLQTGGETVLEYAAPVYDLDLPESIFSERYLRQAPRRYLR